MIFFMKLWKLNWIKPHTMFHITLWKCWSFAILMYWKCLLLISKPNSAWSSYLEFDLILAQVSWYVVVILWVFSQYLVALLEHCRWYVIRFFFVVVVVYRWRSLKPWAYTSKKSLFVLLQCLNLYCYDIFKNVHLLHLYTYIMVYFVCI